MRTVCVPPQHSRSRLFRLLAHRYQDPTRPELVIGLGTYGDTLRVARSQEIHTWGTRACLPPLDEGLVHAVVGACEAQDPTGVSTGLHPVADAHGEPAPGAFQAHGRLRGAPGGEA